MENNQDTKRSDSETPMVANQADPGQEAMDYNFALALAMQEQENREGDDAQLSTVESDDESSVFSYDEEDYEFFDNRESQEDLRVIEDEEESSGETDLDMEEDDIDPDDMTYEELLALGEVVGEASRGLTTEQISSCLKACEWNSSERNSNTDRCVVCQIEYEEGERLVGLVSCAHPYHEDCISQWLQVKKICPICNTEVVPSQDGAA